MPEKFMSEVKVRMDDPLRSALMELADMEGVEGISLSKYIRGVLRTHVLREMALRERLMSHAQTFRDTGNESEF